MLQLFVKFLKTRFIDPHKTAELAGFTPDQHRSSLDAQASVVITIECLKPGSKFRRVRVQEPKELFIDQDRLHLCSVVQHEVRHSVQLIDLHRYFPFCLIGTSVGGSVFTGKFKIRPVPIYLIAFFQ